jgi:hypothetical protein
MGRTICLFDSILASEPRLKHFPHAAFAKLSGDLTMAKRFAYHEETLVVDSQCDATKAVQT